MFHSCAHQAASPTNALDTVSWSGINSRSAKKPSRASRSDFSRIMARTKAGRGWRGAPFVSVSISVTFSPPSSSSRAEKRFLLRFFRFFRGLEAGTGALWAALFLDKKLLGGSSN
eukprot:Skav232430  [mRNA]  locus=scaffold189:173377:173933:+ [translate_table: standard]